ncbi:MAG: RNA methyltransferase [Candidatus Solibacter sp.]
MLTPETITSAANPLLKEVRRTAARGGLSADGWCIAESFHLLEEALRSRRRVRAVLAAESKRAAAEPLAARLDAGKFLLLPDALFDAIASTENSQGAMALVEPAEWKLQDLFRGKPLLMILDGIQDPGNAGTIVRAAEAFGASGVLFLKGAVSPHNPKTLRASAGSLFRVPFQHGVAAATALATLRQNGVRVFAAMPSGAGTPEQALAATDFTARCALVVGNEAHGVSEEWRDAAAGVTIPTVGVESLNAAMAAVILLYEARRQRMIEP